MGYRGLPKIEMLLVEIAEFVVGIFESVVVKLIV